MSDIIKKTFAITPDEKDRLNKIAKDLGATESEVLRRLLGLGSVVHELIQGAEGDVFVCTKETGGNLQQQHVVSQELF